MESQKHLFSLPDNVHYLNCAYKAPLLKSSEAAAINALKRMRYPGVLKSSDFFEGVERVKELYGSLINAHPSQLALIPSVSYGFAAALLNIKAKTGGNVVTIADGFPSGYYALDKWRKQFDNNLIVVDSPNNESSWTDAILNLISNSTSAVVVPPVHWANGYKFDLKRIGEKCKNVGAYLLVDGTQAIGAIPFDLEEMHISFLICATYKWLMGPYSLGFLYVSPDIDIDQGLEESWMGRQNAQDFKNLTNYTSSYKGPVSALDVGETTHFTLIPMLESSLKQLRDWTMEGIQEYCKNLRSPLIDYLISKNIKFNPSDFYNHLIGIELGSQINMERFDEECKNHNIVLSKRAKSVRIAMNVFNDERDIDALIEAIEDSSV